MAKKTSNSMVLIHFILGLCTGGIWWALLLIKYFLSNTK
jgi:hypothetical protein